MPIAEIGVTHCWAVSLDRFPPDSEPAITAVLDCSEIERASRFKFGRHRRAFICSHAALRLLLSRYLAVSAGSIALARGKYGKPKLEGALGSLNFNISHSGDVALIAVSWAVSVGIDIEEEKEISNIEDISNRYFAPAEHASIQLAPCDARMKAFLKIWTRKEAFLKALGSGLAIPLDTFSVGAADGPAQLSFRTAGVEASMQWTITDLPLVGRRFGAIAVGRRDERFEYRVATWPWLLASEPKH